MTIHIEELKFECIIGILDFERLKPQKVIINSTISYNFSNLEFIDYAKVVTDIKTIMIESKFLLIEDALIAISSMLTKKYAKIEKLNLKITKPSILPECKVSVSYNYLANT